jgi:hypothetical protein
VQPLYTIVLGAPGLSRTETRSGGVFTNEDLARIEKIVREERGFDGFSIAKLTGFWMGRPEECVEIKILTDDLSTVKACAQHLRATFQQESVLVTCQGTGMFLT